MSQHPTNRAFWLPKKQGDFEIGPAPYTSPEKGKLIIKNHALAINLVDNGMKEAGGMIAPWLKYPAIVGSDVSGEVVEIGPGVTRFNVGDRVVALAMGIDKWSSGTAEGGFQEYSMVQENCCSAIPASMKHSDVCVLPLAVATAATGLFHPDYCALDLPTIPVVPKDQAFLVWGGSTSVGCNAIQLVANAGYEVITTASPKNFDLVKKLGASHAFDYRSPTVTQDIIALLKTKKCAGAIAIGGGSAELCIDIIGALPPSPERRFVAQASVGDGSPMPAGGLAMVGFVLGYLKGSATIWVKSKVKGVQTSFFWGSLLSQTEVGDGIFKDFLPRALAEGKFVPAPSAEVVGRGLEGLVGALAKLREGVSAKKLVVSLE